MELRKILTGAVLAFGLAVVPLASGTAAMASIHPNATPACASNCQDFSSKLLGHHVILNAYIAHNTGVAGAGGQVVNMKRADDEQVNADFQVEFVGFVGQFCQSGLNPGGILPSTSVACTHFYFRPAYELDFSPFGNDSGYCGGTAGPSVTGENVRLIPCGSVAGTIWIQDNGVGSAPGYHAYISGATTQFSHPFVGSVDQGTGHPTNQVKLRTENLLTGGQVPDSEQFTFTNGPVS